MVEINDEIVEKVIIHYGKENQSIVVVEECAELIQAVTKELRGKSWKLHVIEEMADVYICLEMLKQMYEITDSDLQEWIDFKQKRAVKRMESED